MKYFLPPKTGNVRIAGGSNIRFPVCLCISVSQCWKL